MMESAVEVANTKTFILQELNERRIRDGKPPLKTYPEVGCTSCGEVHGQDVPLLESRVSYIRICQHCVLKQFPFNRLKLPAGERMGWYRSNPTFHRSSDYGMVLTNHALYLYSPFLLLLSRWRRILLSDIRGASFHDSGLFPALRVHTKDGQAVLRTPWDYYRDEMEFDRKNLKEARERIQAAVAAMQGA